MRIFLFFLWGFQCTLKYPSNTLPPSYIPYTSSRIFWSFHTSYRVCLVPAETALLLAASGRPACRRCVGTSGLPIRRVQGHRRYRPCCHIGCVFQWSRIAYGCMLAPGVICRMSRPLASRLALAVVSSSTAASRSVNFSADRCAWSKAIVPDCSVLSTDACAHECCMEGSMTADQFCERRVVRCGQETTACCVATDIVSG